MRGTAPIFGTRWTSNATTKSLRTRRLSAVTFVWFALESAHRGSRESLKRSQKRENKGEGRWGAKTKEEFSMFDNSPFPLILFPSSAAIATRLGIILTKFRRDAKHKGLDRFISGTRQNPNRHEIHKACMLPQRPPLQLSWSTSARTNFGAWRHEYSQCVRCESRGTGPIVRVTTDGPNSEWYCPTGMIPRLWWIMLIIKTLSLHWVHSLTS